MRHGIMRAGIGRVVLAVMLALGIGAATSGAASGSTSASSTTATLRSFNWAGYVAIACSTCKLRYVSASWRVPAVNCAASPRVAWSYSWVGLDGWTSGSIEQTGTASYCVNGTPGYFAWWVMYPALPPTVAYDVRPGDLITASVYYAATLGRWQLSLYDHSTGARSTVTRPCPAGIECANVDAEVVSEAPDVPALPLADFGSTAYSSVMVTSRNGTRGDMTSNGLWAVHPIDLVGATGHLLASPGPTTGAAFTDVWHAAQ